MGSTNKTTNYDLSQFVGTDKPDWLSDYNADMRSIDSNLKRVSDEAEGASGDISSLAGRMTTAEGNISTNANDISSLDARASALETGATGTASTIASIQQEQIAQNLGIESATRLGYNLARPYDNTSVYAVGDYVLFNDTLYKCTTAVLVGETFDPTKWLAIKATDEIAAGGYTLPVASAERLGGVKVGEGLNIEDGVLSTTSEYTEFSSSTTYFIQNPSEYSYINISTASSNVALTRNTPITQVNTELSCVYKMNNIFVFIYQNMYQFDNINITFDNIVTSRFIGKVLLNQNNEIYTLLNSARHLHYINNVDTFIYSMNTGLLTPCSIRKTASGEIILTDAVNFTTPSRSASGSIYASSAYSRKAIIGII